MSTPFDNAIAAIAAARYHNHRLEAHSDIVSDGIVADLRNTCESFRSDLESGVVRIWKNVASPGDRERKVDLFVGDETLFTEFPWAISKNRPSDPAKTLQLFRTLPVRGSAQTHLVAYDSVLLVPVQIDNVHAPSLPRPNTLDVDVDHDYQDFLSRTCNAYTARWHM